MIDSEVSVEDAYRYCPAIPDEEYVYGACGPGWHSVGSHRTALDQWISFMFEQGIERVCCLMTGRQLAERDGNVGRYREEFGSEKVLHAPIPDDRLADPDLLTGDILPFLEGAVEENEPVVVHCLTGVGRTGQVLAAWLVSHWNYAPRPAVRKVKRMGRDPTEAIRRENATEADLYRLLSSVESVDSPG